MSSSINWAASTFFGIDPPSRRSASDGSSGPWRPPGWQRPQLYSLTFTLPSSSPSAAPNSASATPTVLFFDGVLRAGHRSTSRITEHPVQSTASLVDHVYEMPDYVTLEVFISDAMASFSRGQYTSSSSKGISAWQQLRQLKAARVPITVATRLQQYSNMIIEELATDDTVRTLHALVAIIRFRQLILGTVAVNTVSARPQQNNVTPEGTKPTQAPDPALMKLLDSASSFPQPQWNSNTKGQ